LNPGQIIKYKNYEEPCVPVAATQKRREGKGDNGVSGGCLGVRTPFSEGHQNCFLKFYKFLSVGR